MNVLTGICQYLIDRNVSAKLYSGYIEVQRNATSINIEFSDEASSSVEIKVYRPSIPDNWTVVNSALFDLLDPNSLQAIYEFVTLRINK